METQSDSLLPLSGSQKVALKMAAKRYEEALTVEAARYLLARGIEKETAATFRLGVVDDPDPAHFNYRGMLSIPYLGHDNEPVAIRFRCMKNHDHRANYHGKYNSVAGGANRLFNVGEIIRQAESGSSSIHLTEGEIDAMTLNQAGFPAIAAPGAATWEQRHSVMLAGFDKVYIWGDPDSAGAEFVQKVEAGLRGSGVPIRLTEGDVNDVYVQGGREAIREAFDRSVRPV